MSRFANVVVVELLLAALVPAPVAMSADAAESKPKQVHAFQKDSSQVLTVIGDDNLGRLSLLDVAKPTKPSPLVLAPRTAPERLSVQGPAGALLPLRQDQIRPQSAKSLDQIMRAFQNENRLAGKDGASSRTSSPEMMEALKRVLRESGAGVLNSTLLDEAKKAGEARLSMDRQAFVSRLAGKTAPAPRTVSNTQPGLARKMDLLPLPAQPAVPPVQIRQRDIDRLTSAIAVSTNPDNRDRLSLDLAAAYVGSGLRDRAIAIYESLAQSAASQGIHETAQRNLRILSGLEPPASASRGGPTPTARPKSAKGGAGQ